MTTAKKARYQKLYDHYTEYLGKLMDAQLALISGGVKSYTIDDRTLTRFDIDKLAEEIESIMTKLDEYEAILDGGSRRKAVGIVPRDT